MPVANASTERRPPSLRAARRVAHELDVAWVLTRMQDAVKSRRVTARPAPDGMAHLTVLGPMVEVVGAAAALRRRGRRSRVEVHLVMTYWALVPSGLLTRTAVSLSCVQTHGCRPLW